MGLLEGFLCPSCHKKFTREDELTQHFSSFHVGKPNGSPSEFQPPTFLNDEQKIGDLKDDSDLLQNLREKYNKNKQANAKLIWRLSRLLSGLRSAENMANKSLSKAKILEVEKSVVHWIEDDKSSTCSCCEKPYSVILRRHHCRLCGNLVCSKCSYFISYDDTELFTTTYMGWPETSATHVELKFSEKFTPNSIRMCTCCRLFILKKATGLNEYKEGNDLKTLYATLTEKMARTRTMVENLQAMEEDDEDYENVRDVVREACVDVEKCSSEFLHYAESIKNTFPLKSKLCTNVRSSVIDFIQTQMGVISI